MEHPAGAGIEPADTIPAIFAGFSPARIPGAVSRHIRLDPSLQRSAPPISALVRQAGFKPASIGVSSPCSVI